ncbi:DUF4337 family protein [Geodermatophilus ruber]|uniref:DUF4337 domain-containing protein n=1 Tax=Geodermatophilus ruber TaxID=504800 RepID=A0A1I4DUD3_9ACTN|nr:DUF4337 family protein [Geodermatophilus ruber]SFK97174.1 protein of unknown function [Geodermatophilus ruber]
MAQHADTADTTDQTESRERRLEIIAAVLLGLAAVATAWSAYWSAIFGGNAIQGYAQANTFTSQVSEAYGEGDTQKAFDQSLFVTYAAELFRGDPEGLAAYIYSDVATDEFRAAIDWFNTTGDEVISPFDVDSGSPYAVPGYERGNGYLAEADAAYQEAVAADDKGDRFDLAAVFLALSLFFGGIATVFKRRLPQLVTLTVGSVGFVIGLGAVIWAHMA